MKPICAILLLAGVCLLAPNSSAQTPPTTPCVNGQPYVLVNGKYQCPTMPPCARRCTLDDHQPGQCYLADRVRFWGTHDTTIVRNEPDGTLPIYDWTGFRLDTQRVNG